MMLQFVKPLAAVFTFIIGTFAAYVLMPLPEFHVVGCNFGSTDQVDLVETPLCQLGTYPELYERKLVRVRLDIRLVHTADSTELVAYHCGARSMRIDCRKGYESCYQLLDKIAHTRPDEIEIYADGRFYNSAISYERDGTSRRIPLFEIEETRSVRVGGEKLPGDDGMFNDDVSDETGDGRGTGRGHGNGSGTGYGTGQGTGSGSGRGTGNGRGVYTESGGGGSGGRDL